MSETKTKVAETNAAESATPSTNGESRGELAPIDSQARQMQEAANRGYQPMAFGFAAWDTNCAIVDNFDGDDQQRFRLRMLAMNDAEPVADHLNEKIPVRYWMCHEVQIADEQGEVEDCVRTVLITPDGKAFACVSFVVAKAVREICRTYGQDPLDPPLPVKISQKSKGAKRMYILKVAE